MEPTAVEIRDRILRKEVSAVDVVQNFLGRIDAVDPKIHAFLTVLKDEALEQARGIDAKKQKGPLAGVPVAIKDNICIRGTKTTCGSKILENYVAPYDAHVIERLRAADAILIGKTNLDEFAMGSSTENSAFGPTRNPFDLERVPGGSSGGSAAAVAAGEAPLALGSDTGGSIRQPAALTGIVGFKPTYGRVSRYGLVAFASSLDQIGPFGRTVADAALLFEAIVGHDSRDSTSASVAWKSSPRDLAGLRIGVPDEYFGEGLDPEVRTAVLEALSRAERKGAQRVRVSLPTTRYGIAAYYIVAPSEASSNLARYDGVHYGHRTKNVEDVLSLYSRSRSEGFGPEVTRRIILGTFALSSGYYDAYYNRALKVRRRIQADFNAAFAQADVILGPTSPTAAFRIGDKSEDPLSMYLCDVYTVATNLAGLPGISIPCGLTKAGLPIGLQLQGRAFDDAQVLAVAAALEKELGMAPLVPKL